MDPLITRRSVLLGGAGALLVTACGGATSSSSTTTAAGPGTTASPGFALLQLFDPNALLVAEGVQRAPFGVADAQGVPLSEVPPSLSFIVTRDGAAAGPPITVNRHADGLPRPYFPLVFTPDEPGLYTASTAVEGQAVEATFTVSEPDAVPVPRPGQTMEPFDTPTVDDNRGVDPICTREPACPLHDVTLTDALAEGKPIAYLVSTPKYCQVAICGPVLDVLLDARAEFPEIRMLHAEVWTDDTTTVVAPAVAAYNLDYEPVLFLADGRGTLRQRLDNVYDASELAAGLRALLTGP